MKTAPKYFRKLTDSDKCFAYYQAEMEKGFAKYRAGWKALRQPTIYRLPARTR